MATTRISDKTKTIYVSYDDAASYMEEWLEACGHSDGIPHAKGESSEYRELNIDKAIHLDNPRCVGIILQARIIEFEPFSTYQDLVNSHISAFENTMRKKFEHESSAKRKYVENYLARLNTPEGDYIPQLTIEGSKAYFRENIHKELDALYNLPLDQAKNESTIVAFCKALTDFQLKVEDFGLYDKKLAGAFEKAMTFCNDVFVDLYSEGDR